MKENAKRTLNLLKNILEQLFCWSLPKGCLPLVFLDFLSMMSIVFIY